MDKYHIYEEVGAGQHSQVFKGREKMDIEYVAIKRVEKSMMESVVKEVQVIHRLSSPNVLKFYDWYETRNNVWLILEFCTGGDLLTLIKQDHREPESAVRLFGVDLLAGLQQTHACGYLHGDLRPSNVLIDEYGILKLSGFGLAQGVPEDGAGGGGLDGVAGDTSCSGQQQQQGCGGVEKAPAGDEVKAVLGRDPTYMAPELLSGGGGAMSFASDFWSLGCVLFELLTGEPPFRASTSATTAERIERESPPGLDKGEWQGASMSTQFCELTSWLLRKDPLLRPTWPQLLAHPFWGNCQTPSSLEMPPQPRFDRALAASAAAAAVSAAAATATAEGAYAANQSRGSLERSRMSEQGRDGAAAVAAVASVAAAALGKRGAQAGEGRSGSTSYADLAEDTPEAGRWEGRGGHTEEEQEEGEEAEERKHRWRPAGTNSGAYGSDGARGGADGCQRNAACTGRASPVSGRVGNLGNPRGGQGGSGVGRGGDRETTPPRAFPDKAETERWKSTDPPEGPPGPEGQPLHGRHPAEQHRRINGHERRNGHLDGAAAANDDGRSHSRVAGKDQDSGFPSPVPPVPLAAAVDRRNVAACHGLSQNVIVESIAANDGECRAVGVRERREGDAGADADAAKSAAAAAAAAALSGLRMRGRIPPARGGRSSPSVVSVVSVSSSAGEQYGSSFEEDTEAGSSCCSANGGTSGGGGSGSVGSGSVCSGGGGRSGGFGRLDSDPSMMARAATGKAKGVTGRGGRDAGAAVVMTPCSVGTATTATPSTGPASSTRGRRGSSSSSYSAGAVKFGREGAPARKENTNAAADSDATTSSPCVGGRRPQRASPVSSAGSTFGPGRARSRLGFPPATAAAGAASVGSGSSSASPGFATTTLRFEQGEGSLVSERVSISSWTLSSGVSTARFSRETEACVGVSGGGWDGSASRRQEAQEGRPMPDRAPVGGIDAGLRNSRSGIVGGEVSSSIEGGSRSPVGRVNGDDPRLGSPQPPAESVAPNHGFDDDNDGDYDNPQATAKGDATRSREAAASADVARSASPEGRGVQELLLHTSDAQVSPIVGSRCIEPARARAEPSRDQLPFEALPLGAVSAMPPPALEAHLTVAYNALTETQAPVRQTGQTLLYLQSLAPIPRVSNLLINSTFLVLLLRLLRKPRPAAIRDTVATLLGLLVRHATYIAPAAGRAPGQSSSVRGGGGGGGRVAVDGEAGGGRPGSTARRRDDNGSDPSGAGGGLMPSLISTIRDKPPPGRSAQAAALRRNAVAALGELLFYVVTQEPRDRSHEASGGDAGDTEEGQAWSIPSADVGDAIRVCLEDAEHGGGQHYAAKTVENVLAQAGPSHPLVRVFVTPELALGLLNLARRAPSESLRGTAAAGLSHLLAHDVLGAGGDDNSTTTTGCPVGCGVGMPGRRLQDNEKLTIHSCESGYGQVAAETGARRGWIAARVMSELEAPAAVVKGLSEGSFPASRRAFLNVLNLVLWVSRRFGGSSDGAITAGAGGGNESAAEGAGYGMGEGTSALRRGVESMLCSQHLLPRLLHVAEHGEGAILRAKGFLALRLTLEVAPPALLLKACRSRLLPLLARVLGGLTPRATCGPGAGAGAAVAATAAAPILSVQQEYLYECCTKLADWLSTVPETAARRLLTELQRRRAGVVKECQSAWRPRGASGSRRPIRQQAAVAAVSAARTTELETAMAIFPAVVHLVNSPLLRRRAVTSAFLYDVAGCLSLSCPTTRERVAVDKEDGGGGGGVVSSAASAADTFDAEGSGPGAALAALLPTVETLAQQTELVLLPHWQTVSTELVPVLCRLLGSPSGDTRALALAVLRVLLPPFMRQTHSPQPQPHILDQAAAVTMLTGGNGGAQSVATESPGEVGSPAMMRSAITVHLLPLAAALWSDHTPVPQYTVRLLIDVSREWDGLGAALLAEAGALPALLGRLPPPTPSPSTSASPFSDAAHAVGSSPRSQRAADMRRAGHGPGDDAAAALDPAVAALLTLLVERDDGGDDECRGRGSGGIQRPSGSESDANSGREELFAELLRLELPGRVAAAVTGAVAAGMPEAMEAFLALAVALLGAGCRYEEARQGRRHAGPSGGDYSPRGSDFGRPNATGGERAAGSNRRGSGSGAKEQLGPLLAAVPAAVEGVKSFCVHDVLARRREQLSGARREPVVDDSVRSGLSDSATLFLEMCYKVFHDDLLWSLLFCSSRAAVGGAALGSALSAPSPAARSCRHLADFLGCSDVDERPRLRIIHLLLAAASARDRTFHGAVGQGLLWTALLRLATGRGVADASGRSRSVRGATAATTRGGGGAPLGPMNALAKEVVAAIREDKDCYGAESRRWSGRAGGGDG